MSGRVNGTSSNTILDRLGHEAHVLSEDEHAQTSALIPNMRSVQAQRELNLGAQAFETGRDLLVDGLPEFVGSAAGAGAGAALVGPALLAYSTLKSFHQDWLNRHPQDVRTLQKSADQGFLDAEKAWQAVQGLSSEQRLPALLKQLTMAGKGDKLQSDLAYGKGIEAFLYVQQHPEIAASETDKVHARTGRPLQIPFNVRG